MIGPGSLGGGRVCYGYGSTRILLSYPIKMKPQDYAIRIEVRTMNISLFFFSSRCGNRPVLGLWSMHYNLWARGSLFSANRPDKPCIFFSFSLSFLYILIVCIIVFLKHSGLNYFSVPKKYLV